MNSQRGHVDAQSDAERDSLPPTSLTVASGPWTVSRVTDFLTKTVIPIRLATIGTWPLVQSMWFRYHDDRLWCATRADAIVVRRLQADPRCGFEVARDDPPYAGVRGHGVAEILPQSGRETLTKLADRYLGTQNQSLRDWLLARADDEVAIAVRDLVVTSWDFSRRMSADTEGAESEPT